MPSYLIVKVIHFIDWAVFGLYSHSHIVVKYDTFVGMFSCSCGKSLVKTLKLNMDLKWKAEFH